LSYNCSWFWTRTQERDALDTYHHCTSQDARWHPLPCCRKPSTYFSVNTFILVLLTMCVIWCLNAFGLSPPLLSCGESGYISLSLVQLSWHVGVIFLSANVKSFMVPLSACLWQSTQEIARFYPGHLLLPPFRWDKVSAGVSTPVSYGDTRGALLSFNKVEMAANGSYRCEASNPLGSMVIDIDLLVQEPPTVTALPTKQFLTMGQSAEIECRVTPPMPTAQFTWVFRLQIIYCFSFLLSVTIYMMVSRWFKDGKPLVAGNKIDLDGGRLRLFNANLGEQGVYQCFTHIQQQQLQAAAEIRFEGTHDDMWRDHVIVHIHAKSFCKAFSCMMYIVCV